MQQRGNGFATYRNTDFFGLVDGLNFAVQLPGQNGSVSGEGMTNNGRDALRQNGDGVGGSITYDYRRLRYRCCSFQLKRTDDQNGSYISNGVARNYIGTGDRAETYTGGLKYDANNIYLAAQAISGPTTQLRVGSTGLGRTKHRTSKLLLLSTSSTSVCVPSVAYLQSKGKTRVSSMVVTTTTKIS